MMRAMRSARVRVALAAIAMAIALLPGSARADATGATSSAAPLSDPAAVVSVAPTATTPTAPPPAAAAKRGASVQTTTAPPLTSTGRASEAIRNQSGYGNAARQSDRAKRREASRDCVVGRPPVSKLISIGGTVAAGKGSSWHVLALTIGIAAIVLAAIAFLLRHALTPRGETPERGLLETVSTLVGVLATSVGLAVQFVPGIAPGAPPDPQATMRVRDVNARITRGEYAKQTGVRVHLAQIDRRQVGDVVWLQIGLHGYGGKHIVLQYAMYDPRAGGPLLPGTEKEVGLNVADRDEQTSFVPIWVGYPKSRKFSVQFRLLSGSPLEVREIATTGAMRGSSYRYACGYGHTPSA